MACSLSYFPQVLEVQYSVPDEDSFLMSDVLAVDHICRRV